MVLGDSFGGRGRIGVVLREKRENAGRTQKSVKTGAQKGKKESRGSARPPGSTRFLEPPFDARVTAEQTHGRGGTRVDGQEEGEIRLTTKPKPRLMEQEH